MKFPIQIVDADGVEMVINTRKELMENIKKSPPTELFAVYSTVNKSYGDRDGFLVRGVLDYKDIPLFVSINAAKDKIGYHRRLNEWGWVIQKYVDNKLTETIPLVFRR